MKTTSKRKDSKVTHKTWQRNSAAPKDLNNVMKATILDKQLTATAPPAIVKNKKKDDRSYLPRTSADYYKKSSVAGELEGGGGGGQGHIRVEQDNLKLLFSHQGWSEAQRESCKTPGARHLARPAITPTPLRTPFLPKPSTLSEISSARREATGGNEKERGARAMKNHARQGHN